VEILVEVSEKVAFACVFVPSCVLVVLVCFFARPYGMFNVATHNRKKPIGVSFGEHFVKMIWFPKMPNIDVKLIASCFCKL
jgi:hypothetical protein